MAYNEASRMKTYEFLCKSNWDLIKGKNYTLEEKKDISDTLFSSVCPENEIQRYHMAVKAPDDGRIMYPLFFIPPYNNGKKLITISSLYCPKFHMMLWNRKKILM
jgi:hypothetical protein